MAAGIPGIDEGIRRRVGGYPGGSVCGNGIRAHGGSRRTGSGARRGHRSTETPACARDARKPRVRSPDPDCPTGASNRRLWSTLRQWSSSTIRDMNGIGTRNPMWPRHCERRTMVSDPDGAGTRPGVNLLQHHLLSRQVARPRPDRVRCSFEEDRRVHTCGPEAAGGLS